MPPDGDAVAAELRLGTSSRILVDGTVLSYLAILCRLNCSDCTIVASECYC